jgi:GDP-mannose 6-dehydrogenase
VLPSNHLQIEAARLKVHELGARRVAVLGLSFKPSTDDLRESPIIGLIRALWQDGLDVLIHDPDVQPETMLGSNRTYLERQLPQIHQILRPHIGEVLHKCHVVVVSQKRPEFTAALQTLNGRVTVLDLVRLHDDPAALGLSKYRGISW